MSGAEVLGVISAIIGIVDAGIKVYDAISDASGLPESFRDVAKRMGLIHVSLENIAGQLSKRELSERAWKAINDVVQDCERKAQELDAIFRQALPDDNTSRMERPLLTLRALGKGGKVDSLMDSIVKDVSILTLNHVSQSANESQMVDLKQHLDKLTLLSSAHTGSPNPTAERDALLKELNWKDPQLAKNRIERIKGGLYDAASDWILSHPSYGLWKNEDTKLLWIKGAAGKGKTMLLMTILKDLRARGVQPSTEEAQSVYFFCQNKEPEANNAVSVLKGLIASLLMQDEQLAGVLKGHCDRLGREAFDPAKCGDSNTFDTLATVFKDLVQSSRADKIFLAVDALDECDLGQSDLINLVTDTSIEQDKLRWIVTSRLHVRVADSLALNLEVTQEAVNQGIKAYISHKVLRIPAVATEEALRVSVEQKLFEKAEGTFLWVDQVLRIVHDFPSYELEQGIREIPSGLTELYERMLHDLELSGGRYQEPCLTVLRVLTLAKRSLNVQELQVLAGLEEFRRGDMEEIINRCGSFVVLRPETGRIYPIHQSAIDFLLGDKSLARVFPLGKTAVHRAIVENSLQAMSRILKRNIYDLEEPGALTSEVTRPAPSVDPLYTIDYSCVYWVNHACLATSPGALHPSDGLSQPDKRPISSRFWQRFGRDKDKGAKDERSRQTKSNRLSISSRLKRGISPGRQTDENEGLGSNTNDVKDSEAQSGQTMNNDIYGSVAIFIKGYLLYWLEATSLLGCVSKVALALALLQPVLDAVLSPENDAGKVLEDSYRFFIHHQATIAEAPLQVYVSALLFSPRNSIVRRLFSDLEPRWVLKKPDALSEWTSRHTRLAFSDPQDIHYALSFSSSGSLVAALTEVKSAFGKGVSLWIWEMHSGRVMRKLKVDDDRSTIDWYGAHLTFSSDDTYIGLWTWDTMLIWHVDTGAQVSTFKSAGGGGFETIVFCRDQNQAVSASESGAIRFWNIESGEEDLSQKAAIAPIQDASRIDLSPDGCQIAWSSFSDDVIRIRSVKSQRQPQELTRRGKVVKRLLFSRNSQRLMTWSTDDKIRVWDVAAGKAIYVYTSRRSSTGGTISTDGSLIAVPGDGSQMEIIDTKSGYKHCAMKLTQPWAYEHMEISPDRRHVATLMHGLNIWDTKFMPKVDDDDGETRPNSGIKASMNGRCFAMLFGQGVRVWYVGPARTDTCKEHWVGNYDEVEEMSISADGERLAILGRQGDQDCLTVWNTSTGRREFDVEVIEDVLILQIRLSRRGTFVAVESDLNLMCCDGQSTSRHPLEGPFGVKGAWTWVFSQDEVYYAVWTSDVITVHETKSAERVWMHSRRHHPEEQGKLDHVKHVALLPTSRDVTRFNLTHHGVLEVWNWSMQPETIRACDITADGIFSPDSAYLLFPDRNKLELQLWDIQRDTQLAAINIEELKLPNTETSGRWHFVASEDPSLHWLCDMAGNFKVAFHFSSGDNAEASYSTVDPAAAASATAAATFICKALPWEKVGPWLCFQGRRMLRLPPEYDSDTDFHFLKDGASFYVSTDQPERRISVMRLSLDPLQTP